MYVMELISTNEISLQIIFYGYFTLKCHTFPIRAILCSCGCKPNVKIEK